MLQYPDFSPFRRRLRAVGYPVVPPEGTAEAANLQKLMDMDIAFQAKWKAFTQRMPHVITARMMGGSGLQMAKLLRSYFLEYTNRIFKYGPASFPSSFNVIESFLEFNREYMFYDLRDEVEHLLSIDDYFRWYKLGEIPTHPRLLEDVIQEGKVYSYDFISDTSNFRISGASQQVFAGVSFVRHSYELSCLLLAGENPPLHADGFDFGGLPRNVGRKEITPDPNLTSKDRYLDGYPSFAKVIVLTRFDLRAERHDVRYINLDEGQSFSVLTDDTSVFWDPPAEELERIRSGMCEQLKRYDDLFAALASMIYLPAFFAAFPERLSELEVTTELKAQRYDEPIRQTWNEIGQDQCIGNRIIHCFPVVLTANRAPVEEMSPPDLEFKCEGYWKAIEPHLIGEGKNGERIFGRTWVSRHESWSARSPKSFMLQHVDETQMGPDPGIIYVQRSAAHEQGLFKVGLTRRTAEIRASELSSSTGVPLPFGVLANWNVADCAKVEQEVHRKLAAFRINPRREFFRVELPYICQVIGEVIEDLKRAV